MNSLFRLVFRGIFLWFCLFLFQQNLFAQQPTVVSVDSLPPVDSLPLLSAREYAARFTLQATALEQIWIRKVDGATVQQQYREDLLAVARLDSTITKDSLKILSNAAKRAQKEAKNLQKIQSRVTQTADLGRSLQEADSATLYRQLPVLYRKLRESYTATYPPEPQPEPPVAQILSQPPPPPAATDSLSVGNETPAPTEKIQQQGPKVAVYDPKKDVLLNPPSQPCRLARESRDAFSGELYRETQRMELFRFTNAVMKKLLGNQPHILCEASFTSQGERLFLSLHFTIHDAAARRTFGGFASNSTLMLRFIDGVTYSLYNMQADEGTPDPSGQYFVYRARFPVERNMVRKMQTTELDKIRVNWITGYEDYNIYQVDALMRLLDCLQQPKS